MNINNNNIDDFIKKSMEGFEVRPPSQIKSSVFNKLFFYNLWLRRKRLLPFVIALLMVSSGAIGYSIYNPQLSISALKIYSIKKNTFKPLTQQPFENAQSEPQIQNDNKINNKETVKSSKAIDEQKSEPTKILTQKNDNDKIIPAKENNFNTQKNQNSNNNIIEKPALIALSNNSIQTPVNINPQEDIKTELITSYSPLPSPMALYNPNNLPECLASINSPKFKTQFLWSGSINYDIPIYSNSRTFEGSDQLAQKYSSSFKNTFGPIGINFRAEKKNLFFDFGIKYSSFQEKIQTPFGLTNPYDKENIDLIGHYITVDTSAYYHYYWISDSTVRIIDSVWTVEFDSTSHNLYDTTYTKIYDTVHNPVLSVKYTRLDFPLFIGWNTMVKRFQFGVSTGPIINLFINTNNSISPDYIYYETFKDLNGKFSKFKVGLSWQISASAGYFITNRLVVELSPYYRFRVINVKPDYSNATIRTSEIGVNAGIRYFF